MIKQIPFPWPEEQLEPEYNLVWEKVLGPAILSVVRLPEGDSVLCQASATRRTAVERLDKTTDGIQACFQARSV